MQLRYKAIDRLIHFTVCAVCTASVARHFKQYYNSISTTYTCNFFLISSSKILMFLSK